MIPDLTSRTQGLILAPMLNAPTPMAHDQPEVTLAGLRALVSTVINGGEAQAARASGLSPSVISRHLQNLESGLGVPLFQRTQTESPAQGAKLTIEGALLFDAARSVLGVLDPTLRNIASLGDLRANWQPSGE